MSDATRLISVKIGINAATSTFGTEPAAYVPIIPRAEVPSLFPRVREHISRAALQTVDGRLLPPLLGNKDLSDITLPVELSGVNDNTGAAVADWEAKLDIGKVLVAAFGAVAPATVGATTACSGAAGAVLTLVDGMNYPNLAVIRFANEDGEIFVRQIVADGGTNTVTLDRAFTGTATGNATRMAVYALVPSRTKNKDLWIDAEGMTDASAWRRIYKDCHCKSLQITVPDSGIVTLDAVFKPNDWIDDDKDTPAFVQPDAGSPIVTGGAAFYIGAVKKLFKSFALQVDFGFDPRPTPVGANNVQGGDNVLMKSATFSFELFLGGDDGTIGDISDDVAGVDLGDLQGDASVIGTPVTTQDISLQVGTEVGALWWARAPAAACLAPVKSSGGYLVAETAATLTGAAPLYIAFG